MQSVTEFIDTFFPEFEREKIAAICAEKRGCTVIEILQEWENKKDSACNIGEYVHAYIERKLSDKKFPYEMTVLDEYSGYIDSVNDAIETLFKFYKIEEAEKKVVSENLGLTGCIDCILSCDNKIVFIDWKTSQTIRYSNPWSKGLEPITFLDNCNYNKYCLQLHAYIKIAEDINLYPGKDITCGILHLRKDGYELIEVPDAFRHHLDSIIKS